MAAVDVADFEFFDIFRALGLDPFCGAHTLNKFADLDKAFKSAMFVLHPNWCSKSPPDVDVSNARLS